MMIPAQRHSQETSKKKQPNKAVRIYQFGEI